MFKILLSIFLVLLCHHESLAQDRFIVLVSEYESDLGDAVPRCPATVITDRHVLTTAACATPTNSSMKLAIDIFFIFPGGSSSSKRQVSRVFIHPNYAGDAHSNNIAVIQMNARFNTTTIPPRTLGSITTNSTCTLFGWGDASVNPETVVVQTHAPEFCDASLPQAYCSEHLPSGRACAADAGSPLICNAQAVDGIFLQTGCREYASSGRFLVSYHSVGEFKDWIEIVSGSELKSKISIILLVTVVVTCVKNLV